MVVCQSVRLARKHRGPILLRQRLVTAAIGIAILLAALWFGGLWGWVAFVGVAAAIGTAEFYRMVTRAGGHPLAILGCLWAVVFVIGPALWGRQDAAAILTLSAGLVVSASWFLFKQRTGNAALDWAWTAAGVLYVAWLARYLVCLRLLPDGRVLVFLALAAAFATDTSAYFVGRSLGRHKLASRVSPKKTWEGAVAGIGGSIAACLLISHFMSELRLAIWSAVLLGFMIGMAAQIGDLIESLFKRSFGAKDSGTLMPGHGGLLDRADSVLLVAPVVYYLFVYIV